jgi:toxin ParE1/3/4
VRKYALSPQADADLVGIYEYTLSKWGTEQFQIYRKQIEAALRAIAADPVLRGSRKRDDILPECRFYRVEHHYIVYRVADNLVQAGRILHERMHFEEQVSGDDFEKSPGHSASWSSDSKLPVLSAVVMAAAQWQSLRRAI